MSPKRQDHNFAEQSLQYRRLEVTIDSYLRPYRQSPQLCDLPVELLLMIADNLDHRDFCHFAAITKRNWVIFRPKCHKMALKTAYLPGLDSIFFPKSWFFRAVRKGNLKTVSSFLFHGVDPNSPDSMGMRALHVAVGCPSSRVMTKLLLTHGANPDLSAIDHAYITPVYMAALTENRTVTCLLMLHGADVRKGHVIHQMAANSDVDLVRHAIFFGADVHDVTDKGYNLLHSAARNPSSLVLSELLGRGLESMINSVNQYGRTPLLEAIGYKHVENVNILLQHGANPNVLCRDGSSALQKACCLNEEDAVGALITAGANIELAGPGGKKAIHCAATISAAITRVVLAGGANVMAT
ncbi:ankyrin repeat-containing domain protein, partial [Talaromyces proteolyticus]